MIRVDRSRIKKPSLFETRAFNEFVEELTDFNLRGATRATQVRFPWEKRLMRFATEALSELRQLFNAKCAYTEVSVSRTFDGIAEGEAEDDRPLSPATLVLHRPPADAKDLDGAPSPEHYWWLIPEWSNWYLADSSMRQIKARQFPVVGSRMTIPSGRPVTMGPLDAGLLLDPCRDEPAFYLEFKEDGQVVNRPFFGPEHEETFGDEQRGEHTIRILDLNGEWLVDRRAATASSMRRSIRSSPLERFHEYIDPNANFLALRRQLLVNWCIENVLKGASDHAEWVAEHLPVELVATLMGRSIALSDKQLEQITSAIEHVERDFSDAAASRPFAAVFEGAPPQVPISVPSHEEEKARPIISTSSRLVGIRIRNFRAIKEVEFGLSLDAEIPADTFEEAGRGIAEIVVGWKALLGENGSGKSCLLEAIGLALSGDRLPEVMEHANLSWSKILRRPSPSGKPVHQGRVLLTFTGNVKVDLRFNKNKHWWIGGTPDMQAFVRGYGATRLLASDTENLLAPSENVRVANLYDPRAFVINAKQWLLSISEEDFNVAALLIADLLAQPPNTGGPESYGDTGRLLTRNTEDVFVEGDPLDLVSDGYRAVIAIACDIVAGLGEGLSSMLSASGIVLIDEIGAHLHPSWRMRITETLRRALPNVQFIISTHEPLCLRGLIEREVLRVRKTPELGVTLEEIDRSPSNYRVDQLLTSEFFGMDTTIDPGLESRFQAYHRLLAKPEDERTNIEQQRLDQLKDYIRRHSNPVLGPTRRAQLVYEAIDEFLSKDGDRTEADRTEQRKQVLESIKDIWEMRRAFSPHISDTP